MTARKLNAFIKKQIPAPNCSNMIPEIAGPMSRAKFTMDELSAIAFGRYSILSTIWYTNDCLAGTSKALIMPSTTLNANISHIVYCVKRTKATSSVA